MRIASKQDLWLFLIPLTVVCLLLAGTGERTRAVSPPSALTTPAEAPPEASTTPQARFAVTIEDKRHRGRTTLPLTGEGWSHDKLYDGRPVVSVTWKRAPDTPDGTYDFEITDHTSQPHPRVIQRRRMPDQLGSLYESDGVSVWIDSRRTE